MTVRGAHANKAMKMGWASYYENIIEKAVDYALLACPAAAGCCQSAPIEAAPCVASPLIFVPAPLKAPKIVSVAERYRNLRDLHVLCLSELRPKASEGAYTRN